MNNLNAEGFSKLIEDSNVVLIDVRTSDEYNSGYIDGALLIDFYDLNFQNRISELDREKPYAIYCRSGHRSGETTKLMSKLGFKNISNLVGGIIEWQSSGKRLSINKMGNPNVQSGYM